MGLARRGPPWGASTAPRWRVSTLAGGRRAAGARFGLLAGVLTALLAALLGAGCAVSGRVANATPSTPAPREQPSPAFAPALDAARAALAQGDEDTAKRVLERLFARGPEGVDRAHAEALWAVLLGRELGRNPPVSLAVHPVEGSQDTAVVLSLLGRGDGGLRLELGQPALVRTRVLVDSRGDQRLERDVVAVSIPEVLVLPAEGQSEPVPVGSYGPGADSALALLETFHLEWRAGAALSPEGARLPLRGLRTNSAKRLRVAGFLPEGPLDGNALLEFLRREDLLLGNRDLRRAQLMERAVRIPLALWPQTREQLAREVGHMDDARLEFAGPALAWLSEGSPNRAPAGWRNWAERELAAREGPELDLPGR